MALLGIIRRIQARLRQWAEWEVAKPLFVKPIFLAVVNHPYRSALCLLLFSYLCVAGVFLHLRCLLEIVLAFFFRRDTQRLVHDVCHNISTLVEKVASFQNLARVEELLSKCDLMNVKLNGVLLMLGFTCLTGFLGVMYYHFPAGNEVGSPQKETPIPPEVTAKASTDADLGDDVSVSDAGRPTNQQPSA